MSGTGQHVAGLSKFLLKRGFEVELATADSTFHLEVPGLKTISFDVAVSLLHMGRRYDVVHAHNVPQSLVFKFVSGKKVLTLHGFFGEQEKILRGSFVGKAAEAFQRKAINWADSVTAVSQSVAQEARGLRPDVLFIPNAVDPEDLPPLAEKRRGVVYSGRLSREKGVDVLPEVARRLPDVRFRIIGDGPLFQKLKAESPPNLELLGSLSRSQALEIVASSEVFLLPSRSEGLSTALIEAMMMGVPAVATKVGGNVELLGEGRGCLADNEVDSLVSCLERALRGEVDPRPAQSYALKNYGWERVVDLYISVYRA